MARRAEAVTEPRAPLSKDRVLRTAVGLADEGGIASLTMRKLAAELGVEAMSLYYYVRNKDELLGGMAELVMREIELPTGGADWKAAIRRSAISFHEALRRHPWAMGVLMSPGSLSVARLLYMDALLRRIREAGFSESLTHHAYHALDSHVTGSTAWAAGYREWASKVDVAEVGRRVLEQLPADRHPDFALHLRQHMQGSMRGEKSEFEFGLDLILDGLERLRDGPSTGPVPLRIVAQRKRAPARPRRRGG